MFLVMVLLLSLDRQSASNITALNLDAFKTVMQLSIADEMPKKVAVRNAWR
jgi:hypothetical protein